MKTQLLALVSLACWLELLIAPTSGQLLNQPGQVWKAGNLQGAKYIEIQVTAAAEKTFSGIASFKFGGDWITQEQPFTGTQQPLQGGIIKFDAICSQGTHFSGWLFPGSSPEKNSDDQVCVYVTAAEEYNIPCDPDMDDWGVLEPTTP